MKLHDLAKKRKMLLIACEKKTLNNFCRQHFLVDVLLK